MVRPLAVALFLPLLWGAARPAQSGDVATSTLAWLQRFIFTAYPDAIDWGVEPGITLPPHRDWSGYLPFVTIRFVRSTLGPHRPTAEQQRAAHLLEIELVQDDDGRPSQLIARGSAFDPPADGPVTFGPANEEGMLRALALERFEPLFGKLVVQGTSFIRDAPEEHAKGRWQVNAASPRGAGYVFLVEPARARIVWLSRLEPAPANLRDPWRALEHDTAWIFIAHIDIDTGAWASNPKHEVHRRRSPTASNGNVPGEGDVLRITEPSTAAIVGYKRFGERDRLRSPANQGLSGVDVAGTLPVGALVQVQEISRERAINGMQGIWARVTPAGNRR